MEQITEKKTYRICQISWCALGLVVLLWYAMYRKGIQPETIVRLFPPCVFHSLTGLYCPGCGGTRAILELLRGHILLSLSYHPIVVYTVGLYGWYLFTNTMEWLSQGKLSIGSRYHRWYGIAAVILVIENCLLRNILLIVFHVIL